MKRFVLWAAVSSLPQVEKISLDNQIEQGRQAAAKYDGEIIAELIVPGESRNIVLFEDACTQIEAYAQLRRLIEARAFDVFVFLNHSRVGRTAALAMTVLELCRRHGIIPYDLQNPPPSLIAGKATHSELLIDAIQSVDGQQQINTLTYNHMTGMAKRVRGGAFPGAVPFGWRAVYDMDGRRHIEIDDLAASIIRQALVDLYLNQNMTIRGIATELNRRGYKPPTRQTWDRHSVYNLVKLVDRYAGFAELNKLSPAGRTYIREHGNWPPILTEAEYEVLKEERYSRARTRRGVHSYLFSRLCVCEVCGARIIAHQKSAGRRVETMWYRCTNACKGSYVRESVIMTAMRRAVEYAGELAGHEQIQMPDPGAHLEREVSALDEELDRLAGARRRLTTAYVELATIDAEEYRQRTEEYQQRARAIEARRDDLRQQALIAKSEGDRRARLLEIAKAGLLILDGDTQRANSWLRRHFQVMIRDNRVSSIFYV